jgi:hypothetical protein
LVRSLHRTGPKDAHRPLLLHDSHEEVLKILAWCGIAEEGLVDHYSAIRRWGFNSAVVSLTDAKLAALIKRGEGWPWNGYELRQMKEGGKYPPRRLTLANVRKATPKA